MTVCGLFQSVVEDRQRAIRSCWLLFLPLDAAFLGVLVFDSFAGLKDAMFRSSPVAPSCMAACFGWPTDPRLVM